MWWSFQRPTPKISITYWASVNVPAIQIMRYIFGTGEISCVYVIDYGYIIQSYTHIDGGWMVVCCWCTAKGKTPTKTNCELLILAVRNIFAKRLHICVRPLRHPRKKHFMIYTITHTAQRSHSRSSHWLRHRADHFLLIYIYFNIVWVLRTSFHVLL